MKAELVTQLRRDEKSMRFVYPDNRGYWTLAVGRCVDSRRPACGLRDDEISYLLNNDIDERIDEVTRALPWFQNLDDARKGVLLNMAFQMGTEGMLAFHDTLDLVRQGKYVEASSDMLDSLWARETPERAHRLATQMSTGVWQ